MLLLARGAEFSRLCAHQRGDSSALTCTECSLSARCLEMDGDKQARWELLSLSEAGARECHRSR